MSTRGSVGARQNSVFLLLAATLLVASLAAAPGARAAEVPYLTGRVVDEAGILSPAARNRIEAVLATHEKTTTNQVAVLTVPSLGSDSVEGFAVKVFSTWKLGQKGKDNGVLLVVAPEERRMRIEVGYGLEGILTDGIAGNILRTSLAPRFKAGDYDRGLEDGVAAILAVLEGRGLGDAAAAPSTAAAPAAGSGKGGFNDPELPPWPMRILLGAFIFGIIGLFTVIGVITPGAGWFLYFFLIPFWAMFPIVIVGVKGALALLVTYLVAFPVAKLTIRKKDWYLKAAHDLKSKGSATVGGMVITSGGSGSSSSFGGGGGFSGGGGSSGGGGASGGW
ncbi:MAG: TPM domain-containing protein [Candidatus Methylomirabilia bacterium]